MKAKTHTQVRIEECGGDIHHWAFVEEKSSHLVAIYLDTDFKYFEHSGNGKDFDGIPYITLSLDEETLCNPDLWTGKEIYFPDYLGWNIFSVSTGKDNLSVCLIKRRITIQDIIEHWQNLTRDKRSFEDKIISLIDWLENPIILMLLNFIMGFIDCHTVIRYYHEFFENNDSHKGKMFWHWVGKDSYEAMRTINGLDFNSGE